MNGQPDQDRQVTRQGRVVAIVIAVTTIAWLAIQWAGSQFGWNARYVFLADFAALAAFFWALVVAAQIWRKRRNDET